ncbi:very-long-chain enoyl-CoA reductase-like isoform X1 [Durio zibethinus]|uniref:Very-long-chain enoyl-CoA reductase-like isoform X1 n=2 Tax=Durio zibethinus TaxID=66656 RepID=A0A6P5Z2L9_DURZI|nr:very-long-chain enoyl-CoA reductase-like isoform X1 [Durio zibethinus]
MEVQILFPSSLMVTAASVFTLIYVGILGVLEIGGIHLKYSKFFNTGSSAAASSRIKVPSRVGMFLLYTPAFLVGLASFWLFPDGDLRFLFLRSAVTIHFFKRDFEVVFVHKYSGEMAVDSMIIILFSYFTVSSSLIYIQVLTQGLPQPSLDLKYPGILLFLIAITGNFYHHYLLSKLRAKGGKDYKIPKGGLFGLVICPHYLFEILGFLGISLISQTLYSFCVSLGLALYLMGRSYVTRRWYLSKFDDFPKEVKALIPYVF